MKIPILRGKYKTSFPLSFPLEVGKIISFHTVSHSYSVSTFPAIHGTLLYLFCMKYYNPRLCVFYGCAIPSIGNTLDILYQFMHIFSNIQPDTFDILDIFGSPLEFKLKVLRVGTRFGCKVWDCTEWPTGESLGLKSKGLISLILSLVLETP